eukprot:4720231-Pyramimonas_sp.AAC.1
MVTAGIHHSHHPGDDAKQLALRQQRTQKSIFVAPRLTGGEKQQQQEKGGPRKEEKEETGSYHVEATPQQTESLDDELCVNPGTAH